MIFKRQNDEKAMVYLKASIYCTRHENAAKYVILFSSVSICLLGIFNKFYMFLEQIPFIANQDNPSQAVTLALAILSGVVMIFQTFLSLRTHRIGIEKNNFLEMYDNYVYNIPSNTLMMRSISSVIIENYARRVKNKKGKYFNHYFATQEQSEKKNAIFDNQYKLFMNDYKLLLYVRGYYLAVWIMFFVGILVISANFNELFLNTLANTLIPSLSIILLIVKSWHSLNEQLRYLQNCTSKLEVLEKNAMDEMSNSLNSKAFIRSVQDAMFSYRKSDFLVPQFVVKMFWKNQRKGLEPESKQQVAPVEEAKVVTEKPASEAKKLTANKSELAKVEKKQTTTTTAKPKTTSKKPTEKAKMSASENVAEKSTKKATSSTKAKKKD